MNDERVEVAVASDANYFHGLLVTVSSLVLQADRLRALRIHVLDGGIPSDDFDFLSTRMKSFHPHVEIVRYKIDDSVLVQFPPWAGNSKMTYARLLLPQLLTDTSHVIYSDCDILWTRDVSKLWNLRGGVMAAVHEEWPVILSKEGSWFAERRLPFVSKEFFTAGMVVFNLDVCRKLDLAGKAMAFISAHRDVQWADQTALNAISWMNGWNVERLSPEWACTVWLMTSELLKTRPILHFAGSAPWKSLIYNRLLTDCVLEWFRVDAKVRSCSVWRSLRRYYSATRIVTSRLLYLIGMSSALGRMVIKGLLVTIGKAQCYSELRQYLYRYPRVCK